MYTRAYANNDLLFLGLFADFYERYLILITPGFIASRQSLLEINVPLGAASLPLFLSFFELPTGTQGVEKEELFPWLELSELLRQ